MDWHALWQRAWTGLGVSATDSALLERLLERYREPHRHYHTLRHLEECFRHFEDLENAAEHPAEVALALFFHDAFYDVHRQDNERKSADWADAALQAAGVADNSCRRVHALVMATCHQAEPQTRDEKLLVDIDLAILGADEARYAEFEAQVRQEYAWVPGFLFRRKRREILKGFLARPVLYHTPALRQRLETRARANLARAIAALGG